MCKPGREYTLFCGHRLVARGGLAEVAREAKARHDRGATDRIALYDDETGRVIDLDLRGTVADVVGRLAEHPMVPDEEKAAIRPRGPGRPKLGVVAREVTLLPRHWAWLATQRGGASAALRRLVEVARRESRAADIAREAQEATYRFIWDMAGDFENFEEATRALFGRDFPTLAQLIERWPQDVREHVERLVARLERLERAADAR